MDKIVSLCRRRGFVFPSSEIYGGLGSTYDYGHYGVLMKNHIRSLWFRAMVQERDDIVAIDSAVILNPAVWEASGHVAGFSDPLDRLPHLQAPLPGRPARGRALRQEAVEAAGRVLGVRPHRAAPVQPHVRDAGRRDGGLRRRGRTCGPETAQGIFINFKNVLAARAAQAAVRHRPGRQVVPQRDHAGQLPLPRARVRADGDGVLRPAGRGGAVVPLLDRAAPHAGTSTSGCARACCACASTTSRSARTTRAGRATSSTSTRSAGRSSRASRTAATST